MTRRSNRTLPFFTLGLVFLLSLPAVTTRLYSSDEIEHFVYLRSLWFDRDLSFDNDYRYFYEQGVAQGGRPREDGTGTYGDNFRRTFLETTTATGLRINFAPIGSALFWAPFYAMADAGVRTAVALGASVRADGFSFPYIASVTYASALYGFLAIALSLVAIRRILGGTDWTVAAVWLGTPLLFYMYVAPGFAHATSAFVVAAFVVTWLRVRDDWSWSGVVALGALAGCMGMVREQDIFIAIGPAVDYILSSASSVRAGVTSIRTAAMKAATGVLTSVVCFLPQAISYIVLYGRFGPESSVAEKMAWTAPYALPVLVSPEHGFLFWTPLALPAIVGLVCLALGRVPRDTPAAGTSSNADARIGLICLIMVASQIYVSGSVSSWTGSTFGQRRLVGLTVVFAIGLASLFRMARDSRPRRWLVFAVIICAWWNLGLIAQFGLNLMNRQRLELARNAYHNFVTIPRLLPSVAYRYAFDRDSFYQRRTEPAP